MPQYRIDELASAAGTTVRNVRVYQDRGLLPAPQKQGRVGIYSEAHLARLRLIGRLLARGYTFANIRELVTVWERGGDLRDILGFESAVGDPWSDEIASYLTMADLVELYQGQVTPETTERAVRLGMLVPEGERFRVPSPRLLHAGAELVQAGMSLTSVLDIAEELQSNVDESASYLVNRVAEHILDVTGQTSLAHGEQLPEVTDLIRRLRPLAQVAVDAMLAQAMEEHLSAFLAEHFADVLERLKDRHVQSA